MQPLFIHLRVHTAYSLLYSTIKNKELAKLCAKNKMPAVAVADINNIFGAYDFCDSMKGEGIQPIIGVTLNFGYKEYCAPLALLVQNEDGYKNLIKLISQHHLKGGVTVDELSGHHHGLIILTGGANGLIGTLLRQSTAQKAAEALQEIRKFAGDRLYMEISRHNRQEDNETEDFFIKTAYDMDIPLVATNEVLFADESMMEAHDAMVCIADKTYVLEENRRRFNDSHAFLSQQQMCEKFADMPEAVANTVNIAKRCSHILKFVKPKFPKFSDDPMFNEDETLDRLAHEGLDKRLEKIPVEKHQEYKDRLKLELSVIKQMGFPGYFLIVYDFINWTKAHNIPVGPGRGSGGGSVVAWSLRITNINPIQYNLLFERFLNPERISMPDFDIDFCQTRRGEVIEYVQKRYGEDHVAQIITFGKLQARAAIRDVGRVLQIPYPLVDKLCKLVPADPNKKVQLQKVINEEPEFAKFASQDERIAKLLDIAVKLEGLYRNCSTHAAGVVISPQPLDEMVALYRDPASDFPVTQFDLRFVENIGLIKYDFLGLKTLTVIDNCVKFVKRFHNVDIDIDAIPLDDKKTYELVTRADTAGVFQLESSGMRNVLTGIKPNCIDNIIEIVTLFRPSAIHLIPSYIARKHGKEKVDYPHPLMEEYLKPTYGYMIYQEQVMQAAQVLAGYSLGRADILRRAMGKKKPEEMAKEESGFIEGCEKTCGIPNVEAKAIFDNIEKFAGYGFNKSHSAAYAIISYQTAYLKANFPLEFFSASMNIDINNTEKLAFYQQELQKSGFKILPPDINISGIEFQPESDSIRYGLAAVRNTGYAAIEGITAMRDEAGAFKSIEDFFGRLDTKQTNRRAIENLIKAGAFDSLHPNRAELLANLETLMAFANEATNSRQSAQLGLFGQETAKLHLEKTRPWTQLEMLKYEAEAVGFYISSHPLESYRKVLDRLRITSSTAIEKNLARMGGAGRFTMAGIIISVAKKISKKGNRFAFVTFNDLAGSFDALCFGDLMNSASDLIVPGKVLITHVTAEPGAEEKPPRITLQSVEPLDKLASASIEKLVVAVNDGKCLSQLKSVIDATPKGRKEILLIVKKDGEDIEISLPEKYSFTPETITSIQAIDGVANVSEL